MYDPELLQLLTLQGPWPTSLTAEEIIPRRAEWVAPAIEDVIAGRPLNVSTITLTSRDGTPFEVAVLASTTASAGKPCFVHPHSGGMVMGSRYTGVEMVADWVEEFGAVALLPEYRLAPEHPFPAGFEDCVATLDHAIEHAASLGVDPARIILAGMSAGGGIAAGMMLQHRDRGGRPLAGVVLMCAMLDARNDSPSALQFAGSGIWDRESNAVGWAALLGDQAPHEIPAEASPSLAEDLTGLPPTFIDVGSMDTFRDEDIDFAQRIRAAGGDVELHVWDGGYHGFDLAFPAAQLSQKALRARADWIRRRLEGSASLTLTTDTARPSTPAPEHQ
ncbi:alpha/beta hydrolase [Microbacterium jejuense]|uniref:alpha/beta hydrolase n=1 Tax=Microbacterium jejuense TaxID=1263637 RepID=UPI0031EFDDD4